MALRLKADVGSVVESGSAIGNVLLNDTSAVRVTQVKAGSGSYIPITSAGATLSGAYGTLTVMQNGTYSYSASVADRLAKGAMATDTFTYMAVSSSGSSASATLKFTVTGINDAPTLTSTAVTLNSITEDQTANGGQALSTIVKPSDADTGAASGVAITGLASGNGRWEFSVNGGTNWSGVGPVSDSAALLLRSSDLVRFVPNGFSGTTASFIYRAWDQTSGQAGAKVGSTINGGETAFSSNSATAFLTVTPVNDAPVANPDTATTELAVPILMNVLANDSDVDGDALVITAAGGSANGVVTIEQNQVRYLPNPGVSGSDTFVYTVSDGAGGTASATASITIGPGAPPVTIILDQDYGYGHYRVGGLPAHSTIDATGASWIVSNSANQNPDALTSYLVGTGVINKYPFIIDPAGEGLRIKGGTIWGEVPQTSDWQYTYNYSHAIRIDSTPNVVIDDWRIDKPWDGIHFRGNSGGFLVDDLYISNVRDDAIENDFGLSGTVRDSLFDGVHVGMGLSSKTNPDVSANTVTFQNVFIRSQLYLVNGEMTHGSFFKTNTNIGGTNPHLRIIDSVFAIEDVTPEMVARLRVAWDQVIESHGNVFLNLTDSPLPSTYPRPPAGFTILEGQVARDYWNRAESGWLANHDGIDDLDLTPLPPLPATAASDLFFP
ncbi:Ig-like domain-containing protein [Sphingomonas sp. GCM10030256]|uniref:Ig-like domain-containing protein n=1 Tax=Sphingomonas sp. GCM10030256 TaxID=3273427 RepID=UPI003620E5FB